MNVYFFIGTTAELIRIAPIVKELNHQCINSKIITSGQVKVHFEDLKGYVDNLRPFISFEEKPNKSSPTHFLLWATKTLIMALIHLRQEFKDKDRRKTFFIICGDPVSTTIGGII